MRVICDPSFVNQEGDACVRVLHGVFRFFNIDAHCYIFRSVNVDQYPWLPSIVIKYGKPHEHEKPSEQFGSLLQELSNTAGGLIDYQALVSDYPCPPVPCVYDLFRITMINMSGLARFLDARIIEIRTLLTSSLQAYGLAEVYHIPHYSGENPPAAFEIALRSDQTAWPSAQHLKSCRQMASLLIEIGVTSNMNFVSVLTPGCKAKELECASRYTSTIEINHALVHSAFLEKVIRIPDNNNSFLVLQSSDFNALTWCYIISCLRRCSIIRGRGDLRLSKSVLERSTWLDRVGHKHKSLFLEVNRPELLSEYKDPILGKTIAKIPVHMKGLPAVLYELETLIDHSSASDQREEQRLPHVVPPPQAERCEIMPAPEGCTGYARARRMHRVRRKYKLCAKGTRKQIGPPAPAIIDHPISRAAYRSFSFSRKKRYLIGARS